MQNRTLTMLAAAVLAVAGASPAMADLKDVTYHFSVSSTGSTEISGVAGTYTDPSNPGFCVGPPLDCSGGSGMSGAFTFSDVTSTLSRITFTFFGSTAGAGPGTFAIDLSDFVTTDGDKITNITYSTGNFLDSGGDFTNVSWNGTTAVFTGSTGTDYDALGGTSVIFNVSLAAVPELATWALLGIGFLGLGLVRWRANRSAQAI